MSYTYSRPATPEERRQGIRRHHVIVNLHEDGHPYRLEWLEEDFPLCGTPIAPTYFLPMCDEPPYVPPGLSRETYEAVLNVAVYDPRFRA